MTARSPTLPTEAAATVTFEPPAPAALKAAAHALEFALALVAHHARVAILLELAVAFEATGIAALAEGACPRTRIGGCAGARRAGGPRRTRATRDEEKRP